MTDQRRLLVFVFDRFYYYNILTRFPKVNDSRLTGCLSTMGNLKSIFDLDKLRNGIHQRGQKGAKSKQYTKNVVVVIIAAIIC